MGETLPGWTSISPRERVVVEAKMTRATLGQREVTDELIVDSARYAQTGAAAR
jgi:hypothetical protein